MGQRPQQPEAARGGKPPLQPEQKAAQDQAKRAGSKQAPEERGEPGKVPEENRPGHTDEEEQDKPSKERFRRRLAGEE